MMKFEHNVRKSWLIGWIFIFDIFWCNLSAFLCFGINVLNLFVFNTDRPDSRHNRIWDMSLFGLSQDSTEKIMLYSGIALLVTGIRGILFASICKINMLIEMEWDKKLPYYFSWDARAMTRCVSILIMFFKLFTDYLFFWYFIYVIFALLGIFVHPFFYAIHLYEIRHKYIFYH